MSDAVVDGDGHPGVLRTGPRRLVIVLVAGLLLVGASIWIARAIAGRTPAPTSWVDGVAQVGADQFSVEHDGWTYGSDLHVLTWIDASGSWHEQGVPGCLRAGPGTSVPVRFQAREVTVEDVTWRPIVAVDCR